MTERYVQVFMAPSHLVGSLEFYGSSALEQVRENRKHYRYTGMIQTDLVGEDAAEAVFGLSNDPSMEDMKEAMGWTGRSLSVGDIVMVDGVQYVCLPVGWKIL